MDQIWTSTSFWTAVWSGMNTIKLEDWFSHNKITIDSRLQIITSSTRASSIQSRSDSQLIPPNTSIASIPTAALLSPKNSTFPSHLLPVETDSTFVLASCLWFELLLATESGWYPYLSRLPLPGECRIGLLWEENGTEREWAKGTELDKELNRLGISP